MSNHKDSIAYGFYKTAEENLNYGVPVTNLVDEILKEVIKAVDFGRTSTWFNTEEYLLKVTNGAVEDLREMGFKVLVDAHGEDEIYILWDFSEEDAKEESEQ